MTQLTLLQTPYPEVCFSSLIGVRGLCEPAAAPPLYWADDVPGIDLEKLAANAGADAPSGASLAAKLLQSAARMVAADVEAIYNGRFRVQASLVAGCSACTFMGNYVAGAERGVALENRTDSAYSAILLDKLTAQVNASGTFHVVLDDGVADHAALIEHDFQAGVPVDFLNIGYRTKQRKLRVYLQEAGVPLAQLSCPSTGSGCGCTGRAAVVSDLVFTGTSAGANSQQAYGFLPCASIVCDAADVLCSLTKVAPRMVGMALLMKFAELYFTAVPFSTRINRVVNQNVDDKVEEAKKYVKYYAERLQGSRSVRGVKDVVFDHLRHLTDTCVTCDTPVRSQWATG